MGQDKKGLRYLGLSISITILENLPHDHLLFLLSLVLCFAFQKQIERQMRQPQTLQSVLQFPSHLPFLLDSFSYQIAPTIRANRPIPKSTMTTWVSCK